MAINMNFRNISHAYDNLNERIWDVVIGKRKWCNSLQTGLREVGRSDK